MTGTIHKRTGEAKREVLELTEQSGQLPQASITEARALAATARRRARGRGAQTKLKAANTLEDRDTQTSTAGEATSGVDAGASADVHDDLAWFSA